MQSSPPPLGVSASRWMPLPLTLYVHVPWCLSKCPYCDFNSHAIREDLPADAYVTQLLADLAETLKQPAAGRPLHAIFIGGGTPSLLAGSCIARLLQGVAALARIEDAAEITLEANPGAADAANFLAYRRAGVNRLSIGVQSLSAAQLRALGRIHGPEQARAAVRMARTAGFDNLNLDLMVGLPGQGVQDAAKDLDAVLRLEPEHISYYQLTLEPNTPFHVQPPALPDDDAVAEMLARGQERLARAGYSQYEVSAHARPGCQCRHNLNYWRFGDYLGIGAGAHGKLSSWVDADLGWRIERTAKHRQPRRYLEGQPQQLTHARRQLATADRVLEFALNRLRLTEGFAQRDFSQATGLAWEQIAPAVERAIAAGLLVQEAERVRHSPRGWDFLNDLLACFA